MAIRTSRTPKARLGHAGTEEATAGVEAPNPQAGAAGERSTTLATKATIFIHQAASVLEREVAAGIRAAQSLENNLVNVASLRSGSPDELMQRIRADVRNVADMVVDLIALSARAVEDVARRAVRITQSTGGEAKDDRRAEMPTLSPDGAAQPGSVATLEMALENAGDESREVVGFQVSALIAPSGARIEAERIHFAPVPLPIPPNGKARVKVSIDIPLDASPAIYSGLMMAQQMHEVRALISVEVAKAAADASGRG